ncbi:MAG: CapA family protein [Prevotella sp.]|nr:CapA family protein [Prevotella sp.]
MTIKPTTPIIGIKTQLRQAMLVAIASIFSCCVGNAQGGTDNTTEPVEPQEHQVTLIFGGDLMQHEPQIKAARTANGTYDYSGVFDYMAPEIQRADIAIANFEVTLGGPPYKGYPQFCAPDEYLKAAIDCGFDVLTTCNNHSVDTRARGINRTIQMMDSLGVKHLGTYRNATEREAQYPFIIEHDSIRICLLNYTYGTNGIPVPEPCVVNLIDTAVIARDIAKAKAMNPDVIICMPHWGDEYVLLPNKGQRDLADWLFAHGVDHIIGGHPHVVEPIEVREQGGEKHLLAYSLGNFVSNQSRPNTDGGTMVRMTLTKRDGHTTLTDCGYNLYWVSRPVTSGRRQYRVLPAGYPADRLNATERAKRDTYLKNTRALFAKHNKGITEYIVEVAEKSH